MTQITLSLSDDRFLRLKKLAENAGVTPEEFARDNLEEWLKEDTVDFETAARMVLQKNRELYRRLAQ